MRRKNTAQRAARMCGFEMTEKKHNSKIDGSDFEIENAKKTA